MKIHYVCTDKVGDISCAKMNAPHMETIKGKNRTLPSPKNANMKREGGGWIKQKSESDCTTTASKVTRKSTCIDTF